MTGSGVLVEGGGVLSGDAVASRRRAIGAFAGYTLAASLVLQRFAVPLGKSGVDVVFPIGVLLAAYAYGSNALTFHRARVRIFLLFLMFITAGAAWQATWPNSYGIAFNNNSLLQFLILTGYCTLSFTEPLSELMFFRQATNILAVIAIAGILQFLLQFVGLRLFAFTGIVPAGLLFETGYNLAIPVGLGSLLKSNGFFLLEPSIFSQVMAMALIMEMIATRRWPFLALFAAGLLLSFSGTGWIVLASFLATIAFTLGSRGILIALAFLMTVTVVFSALIFFVPDTANVFYNRFAEFGNPASSGYLRFVSPYVMVHSVWAREGAAWLLGIGPGAAEKLTLPYLFDVNTPVKILVEYGLPTVITYILLLATSERTQLQRVMFVPTMVLLLFTGGYQEFAPVLFPVFLLICIARLDGSPSNVPAENIFAR